MAKLMVSVRSAEEAALAIEAGADFIDVKEPDNGALGMAASKVWREVTKLVEQTPRTKKQGKLATSLALGEMLDLPKKLAQASMSGYKFAKIGLSSCGSLPDWRDWLGMAFELLPPGISRVAVAYADYAHALSPAPSEILKIGKKLKCKAFLIDTFDKSRGDVFEVMPVTVMRNLFMEARKHRMITVLAGSLKIGRMIDILNAEPDVVAVRRAVCEDSRSGTLLPNMIRLWKKRVSVRQRGPHPHTEFLDT